MTTGERRVELAGFLRARREQLTPQDAGLPAGPRRRTPGLRRQEVAQLAAVSVEWYTRLEQGRVGAPGAAVLDALASALRLTEAQRRHLHLIARGEAPAVRHEPAPVRASLRAVLDGMPLLPAYVMDFRFDVLARNAAATAVFGDALRGNSVRQLFLDDRLRATQLDWARVAREMVGNLRANLGRHPRDARLREVIDELRGASAEFAGWWADQTVTERAHGHKRIRHPEAGELALCYDVLASQDGSEQYLFTVTPAGPADERKLRELIARHSRSRLVAV
ncbi:DNA-binding protein [Actinoplanes ianthinogenes]|uniref:DNA-binding protein n=1 Tax=Actinoplanes ianthinogenes TaxID=122358 RepID=A0ABM7LKR2_9ACTN|nr:helix-turn-helix transcriptional regulator [Actinoplanes ianthinogenes]BCJ39828.1 DNA-binding protein [Actinoplanes ianthinogenes]GGR08422.1 DNA-binding protein [Actinoplanes ianthinogenes]